MLYSRSLGINAVVSHAASIATGQKSVVATAAAVFPQLYLRILFFPLPCTTLNVTVLCILSLPLTCSLFDDSTLSASLWQD